MRWRAGKGGKGLQYRRVNSILARAAALMLTGVPAIVCESVLDEVYCSVRKSIGRKRI